MNPALHSGFGRGINRRRFLARSLAVADVAACPELIAAQALGAEGGVTPANRVTVGLLGKGRPRRL